MPITGVYFIPAHPNNTQSAGVIVERLRSAYSDEDLSPAGRWSLEQKLMRDTPSLLPASANPSAGKPRYMQFLYLTHYPKQGFVYTSEPTEKPYHPPSATSPGSSNATPIPQGIAQAPTPSATSTQPLSQTQSQSSMGNSFTASTDVPPMLMTILPMQSYSMLFQHVVYACQPFWAHRLTVSVQQGVIYDVGDFRVRVGEVRQTYPVARSRGIVVEVEWRGPTLLDTLGSSQTGSGSGVSLGNGEQDADSGIDVDFAIEEADIDAEVAATAELIKEFWTRIGVPGAREAIMVPGFGKEVKERLRKVEGEADLYAGTDLARQYMEVLRFNR
ncbi:Mediator complex subunit Med20 [Penicillium malachiteum]|uniref:Mediator of RNA polymerase II transcription subunit 20 n=1 Tax=Penicillium malachiteum TaxID=1324776 RepID=A0AAD6MZE1_9EURO|nr:Mediator complex subunit Med20 [Penicillium malachiteum]